MRAHYTSTKWLGNVMSIQRFVTKRGEAIMCAMMSSNYMLRIYPSRGFNYHQSLRNPMWSLKEKYDLWPPMTIWVLTPILKVNILVFFITNCKLDGTIPSQSHGQTFYVELEMPMVGPTILYLASLTIWTYTIL